MHADRRKSRDAVKNKPDISHAHAAPKTNADRPFEKQHRREPLPCQPAKPLPLLFVYVASLPATRVQRIKQNFPGDADRRSCAINYREEKQSIRQKVKSSAQPREAKMQL